MRLYKVFLEETGGICTKIEHYEKTILDDPDKLYALNTWKYCLTDSFETRDGYYVKMSFFEFDNKYLSSFHETLYTELSVLLREEKINELIK